MSPNTNQNRPVNGEVSNISSILFSCTAVSPGFSAHFCALDMLVSNCLVQSFLIVVAKSYE
jgi:hypothetical protein